MPLKPAVLNFALGIATFFRRVYWHLFRPITLGVKIIATHNGKILLVKTRYHEHWYLPGGGVKKSETPYAAARRELQEECGLDLSSLRLLGVYSNFQEGKNDHIILFEGIIQESTAPQLGFEIENYCFIEPSHPPEKTSPITIRRLREYTENTLTGGTW